MSKIYLNGPLRCSEIHSTLASYLSLLKQNIVLISCRHKTSIISMLEQTTLYTCTCTCTCTCSSSLLSLTHTGINDIWFLPCNNVLNKTYLPEQNCITMLKKCYPHALLNTASSSQMFPKFLLLHTHVHWNSMSLNSVVKRNLVWRTKQSNILLTMFISY